VKVNIRVLATSNRNMLDAVKKGTFREDLYFRLNVIALEMPSLRDRKDDIKPLAEHFIAKYSKANGVPARKLSDAAVAKMQQYGWPGNVRELENSMHRSVLLATGEKIEPEAILLQGMPESAAVSVQAAASGGPGKSTPTATGGLVGRTVDSVEQELILDTLNYCLGNRTHAANILGISIRTLRNKLKAYSDSGAAVPPPPTGAEG
ncbi:MAG: sigma 54-interacting transcriptional regulator, partial [Rickettsiales bacterium]|nr:sigma 54-interacting transcriptional regulator [Rickettsiales bacterium]